MAGRPAAAKKVKLDNGSGVPAPVQPQHPPPQAYPQYVAWPQAGRGAIPIDPALQGHPPPPPPPGYAYPQYMPPPGSQPHYPPGAYAFHQYHVPPPPPPQHPAPARQAPAASTSGGGGGGGDLHDVSTLNDSLASAGVDLRAEEENLSKAQAGNHKMWNVREDRTKRAAVVDTRLLAQTLNSVAKHHGLGKGAQEDAVQFVAHALRARLQALIAAMVAAAEHRNEAQVGAPPGVYDPHETGTPMWDNVLRRDAALQLAALEKAEREEEMRVRKERKDRLDAQAAQLAALNAPQQGAGAGGGDDDEPKRKKKKEGPGVAARNMSEDVRKKMSNAVASHAAGLGKKYAWMTDGVAGAAPAAAAAAAPKPKPSADTPGPSTPTATTPAASGWAKPYVPAGKSATPTTPAEPEQRRVTLRDAMFVTAHERGHGGGRGAARGWT